MISIKIEGRKATVLSNELLTSGSAGIEVNFTFSEEWEGLTKTAVFIGKETRFVVLGNSQEVQTVIPWETLERILHDYKIGVYGSNGTTTIIPTVYANLGSVFKGASNPSESTPEPTPDVIDQITILAANANTKADLAIEKAAGAEQYAEKAKEYAERAENADAPVEEAKNAALHAIDRKEEAVIESITAAGQVAEHDAQQVIENSKNAAKQDIQTAERDAQQVIENLKNAAKQDIQTKTEQSLSLLPGDVQKVGEDLATLKEALEETDSRLSESVAEIETDTYFYLYNIVEFTGFGDSGASGGITKVGQMYYNTSTKLMRKCVTLTEELGEYETVPLIMGNCYYSLRNKKYYIPFAYASSLALDSQVPLDVSPKISAKVMAETLKEDIYSNLLVFTGKSANGGLCGGVTKVGDVFYSLSSNRFRQAISVNGNDFNYDNAPVKEYYFNRDDGKYYKVINGSLVETEFKGVDKIEDVINGEKHVNEFTAINGYILLDGTVNTTATSYNRTTPIEVKSGDEITFTSSCYTDTSALAFSLDGIKWTSLLKGNAGDGTRATRTYVFDKTGYISLSYDKSKGLTIDITSFDDKSVNARLKELESKPVRSSTMKHFGVQPSADGTNGSFCNTSQGYNELINTVYEPLRNAHPNYIKRENIGKDASGTYDMYVYTFEPRYYQQSILLVGGVHADEIDSIASLARIMQLITNSDGTNEDLEYIRQNIKITVVPCVNVWGYSQTSKRRQNVNGESMQSWNLNPLPKELENLKPVFMAIKDELSFILDMHSTLSDNYKDFYGVINRHDKNVRTIFKTVSWLCDKYAKEGNVDAQVLGYLDGYPGLLTNYWHDKHGITTSTMELSDYHWDTAKSTSTVITMGVTMFLNYIIQQINDGYKVKSDIPFGDYRPSKE